MQVIYDIFLLILYTMINVFVGKIGWEESLLDTRCTWFDDVAPFSIYYTSTVDTAGPLSFKS